MKDAPYLLEPLAEGFAEEAVPVRLALLAAVTKLFFRRPPECQKLLGSVLAAASSDTNQDIHDRALLYYRCSSLPQTPFLSALSSACDITWLGPAHLTGGSTRAWIYQATQAWQMRVGHMESEGAACRLLQHSVKEAERVAGSPLPAVSHFSEEQSSELRDRIFDEFNTLAVILRAPSVTFIKEAPSSLEEEEPDARLVRTFPLAMTGALAVCPTNYLGTGMTLFCVFFEYIHPQV